MMDEQSTINSAFENQQHDLLIDESYLVRATHGQRFANYLIDVFVFYILIFGFGVLIALISPSILAGIDDGPGFSLLDRLFTLIFYALYMGIQETIFKGRSIGKLISGTKAVNFDGSQINAGKAFTRGFSRAVPFCVLSALGSPCIPWQDKWTDTIVIDVIINRHQLY